MEKMRQNIIDIIEWLGYVPNFDHRMANATGEERERLQKAIDRAQGLADSGIDPFRDYDPYENVPMTDKVREDLRFDEKDGWSYKKAALPEMKVAYMKNGKKKTAVITSVETAGGWQGSDNVGYADAVIRTDKGKERIDFESLSTDSLADVARTMGIPQEAYSF